MMQTKCSRWSCCFVPIFLSGVWLAAVDPAQAQTPASPVVTIAYGDGRTLAVRPDFSEASYDYEPVMVFRNQALRVNVQLPTVAAGQLLFVGVDDGDLAEPARSLPLIVGIDGSVSFNYRTPPERGRYSVIFQFRSITYRLLLLVLNSVPPQNPSRFPVAN
jgi:hypothetical protein